MRERGLGLLLAAVALATRPCAPVGAFHPEAVRRSVGETPVTYAQAAAAAAGRNYRTFVSVSGVAGRAPRKLFVDLDTDTELEAAAACATIVPGDSVETQRCVVELSRP